VEKRQELHNDVIDLKELFSIVAKRKNLIYSITILVTLFAIVYAYMLAKPIYQVKAMIEIGQIDKKPLDDINTVKQKFEYTYGVHSKKKREYPRATSIAIGKDSNSVFSVVVEGRNNKEAITFIDKIVQKVEDEYAEKINRYIKTQKDLIALTQADINDTVENLKNIEKSLKNYNQKIMNLSVEDAALAGIYTIQISQNQSRAEGLQSRISALKAKEYTMKLAISPLRIKPTHVVGEVEVLDKPVKPKKALIVIVAFITGLMFSVFLAFFLEFVHSMKKAE